MRYRDSSLYVRRRRPCASLLLPALLLLGAAVSNGWSISNPALRVPLLPSIQLPADPPSTEGGAEQLRHRRPRVPDTFSATAHMKLNGYSMPTGFYYDAINRRTFYNYSIQVR